MNQGEVKSFDWKPSSDICRCCLSDDCNKDISSVYYFAGEKEVCEDMLKETLDIEIAYLHGVSSQLICEDCIVCLRNAYAFKQNILQSEATLRQYYDTYTLHHKDDINTEADLDAADVKAEPRPLDGDCSTEYQNDAGLDDEGITTEADLAVTDVQTQPPALDGARGAEAGPEGDDEELQVKLEMSDAATSDEDFISLACPGRDGAGALSARSVSARAMEQLAMTCSVRLERLRGDKAPHACQICHATFDHESSLATHMEEVHHDCFGVRAEGEAYTCDTCGERYTRKLSLVKHIQEHATKTPYFCEVCSEQFSCKKFFDQHKRTHLANKTDHCSMGFVAKSALSTIAIYTRREPCSCEICKKQFTLTRKLEKHGCFQSDKKPTCDICKKQFTRKSTLIEHISIIHTGKKPYGCEICNKQFTKRGGLNKHIRIHTGQKPYRCEICNKQFVEKGTLTSHIRVHTGQKPYSCDICNKQFTRKDNLEIHTRMHTRQTPYRCEICNKKFTQQGNLKYHIRIHTGQKSYQCEICNKQFTQKGHLTTHTRIHTGHKSYKCEICDKQFTEKGNLTRHIRIHTGQKPYICEICNKNFTQKVNMEKHINVHVR